MPKKEVPELPQSHNQLEEPQLQRTLEEREEILRITNPT